MLALKLLGGTDQSDDFGHRAVAYEQRDLGLGTHITIEHKVEPAGTRQGLEHHPQRRLAKLQRDRTRHRTIGHRHHRRRLSRNLVKLT
ncbi:hypothetical protein SDC9_166124 [bioreactor metagenome]|uniref:Uncharacterized protein n=1 Tax=bioreactor metagenome TaxID=1076179 RepID=A0A645FW49_9ZZZZ